MQPYPLAGGYLILDEPPLIVPAGADVVRTTRIALAEGAVARFPPSSLLKIGFIGAVIPVSVTYKRAADEHLANLVRLDIFPVFANDTHVDAKCRLAY